jgi:DNA-binding CsgD family transcriptional regulator
MASVNPDARLDAVVNLLYDAALDQRLWCGIAARIANTFESTSTVLKTHGVGDHVQLVEVTKNFVIAPKDQDWADHWHRNDLWVERSLALGMSRVITDGDLLPAAEFEKTGFYQDWNRHLGIYHLVGAVFPVDQQTVGVLGIHRPKEAGAYADADRQRVGQFLPHLNRALRIRKRLGDVALVQHASADALDRLDTAVIIVDAQCCVLHANGLANAVLSKPSHIRVHCGRLTFTDPRLDSELVRRVQEATRTAAGKPETPVAALLVDRNGRLPMTVLVTPLRATWDQSGRTPPAAMVFIKDPENAAPVEKTLRELFGLTRTEAAIAAALAKGQDISLIASSFHISIGTARSHLKMILTKTRTHRQAQLVALIAHSVAAIGSSIQGNEN